MPRPQPIPELESVALTRDRPEHGLKAGDIGTVVLVHQNGKGYEVEFCTFGGETVGVLTLEASEVRPLGRGEIATSRRLAG